MANKSTKRLDGGAYGRWYELPDGEKYPSVTNILGIKNKPALVPWAAKEERLMVIDAATKLYMDAPAEPKMTALAFAATLETRLGKEKANRKLLDKASNIGSQVHALIEWNLRKEVGQVVGEEPRIVDAALWAFMAYEDWRKTVKLEPVYIEQTIYSKVYGYAGTLDLAAHITEPGKPRRLCVLDWKTGKAIYEESYLQSAAYTQAFFEMGHCEKVKPPDPRARGGGHHFTELIPPGIIVRLPKNEKDPAFETMTIEPERQPRLLQAFLAAKALWTWDYETKQRDAFAEEDTPALPPSAEPDYTKKAATA